jgi:hypothetical protein
VRGLRLGSINSVVAVAQARKQNNELGEPATDAAVKLTLKRRDSGLKFIRINPWVKEVINWRPHPKEVLKLNERDALRGQARRYAHLLPLVLQTRLVI